MSIDTEHLKLRRIIRETISELMKDWHFERAKWVQVHGNYNGFAAEFARHIKNSHN